MHVHVLIFFSQYWMFWTPTANFWRSLFFITYEYEWEWLVTKQSTVWSLFLSWNYFHEQTYNAAWEWSPFINKKHSYKKLETPQYNLLRLLKRGMKAAPVLVLHLYTKKYHVLAPMGRFQLESIYLYFRPSSQLLLIIIIIIISGTMVENKGKFILHLYTHSLPIDS